MAEQQALTEGWKWIINGGRKFHYFRNGGRSLCGRWMTLAPGGCEPDTGPGPDDCKACRTRLDKEKKTA